MRTPYLVFGSVSTEREVRGAPNVNSNIRPNVLYATPLETCLKALNRETRKQTDVAPLVACQAVSQG